MRWDGWPILGQVFGNLSDLQDLGSECFMRCVCVCVCVCVWVCLFVYVCIMYTYREASPLTLLIYIMCLCGVLDQNCPGVETHM